MLCLGLALGPALARAEVTTSTPAGWSADANASRSALAEADAWAQATGLEATQVASPDEDDEFVENLVVLHDRRPLDPDVLADESAALAALTELASEIFDASAEPVQHELFHTGDTVGERARWEVAGTTWDLLLVPAGTEHALVVLKTRSVDESLHRDLIHDIATDLEGSSAPIAPFPLSIWRLSLLLGWLSLASVVHVIALRRGDRAGDQLAASRRSSLVVALLGVLGTGLTYIVLGGEATALALAGTTTRGLALEMLGAAITCAIVLAALGRLMGGRPERVESAPRTGVFSAEQQSGPANREATTQRTAGAQESPIPRRLGPHADADVGELPQHPGAQPSRTRPRGD